MNCSCSSGLSQQGIEKVKHPTKGKGCALPARAREFSSMSRPFLFLLLLAPLLLEAEVYRGPDLARGLFPRDQVPIDTDTMRELSGYLTDLARREEAKGPAQLRATAQLLAIVVRLDPANRPAREIDKALRNGAPVDPYEDDINGPLRQAWGIADWLLDPEAGPGGQRLGHQLVDALAVINPRSPLAKLHDPGGEADRWQKVVQSLAAFQKQAKVDQKPASPAPVAPPIERAPIVLQQASTRTPLFLYDEEERGRLRVASLQMQVEKLSSPGLFSFSLVPDISPSELDPARNRVQGLLEKSWPHLPVQRVAKISTGLERYASKNEQAISGPAALLMSAALTGKPLRPDVVFIGEVKSDGSLTRPRMSWDYLRVLRVAEGGRLLVPAHLQPELRAMIALEDPSFFLRWEVLVVNSLEVALSLASEGGDPEELEVTSQLYSELREAGRDKDTGQLCVNPKVREHLGEILSKAPFHYSARMLLTQGDAVKRPTRVEREVAARILRSAVEPLTVLARSPLSELSAKRLLTTAEATRAEVESFARFIAPRDRDILSGARDLSQLSETLGLGKREGSLREGELYYRNLPVTTYHQRLQAGFSTFLKNLAPFTGETIAPEPPASDPAKPTTPN